MDTRGWGEGPAKGKLGYMRVKRVKARKREKV